MNRSEAGARYGTGSPGYVREQDLRQEIASLRSRVRSLVDMSGEISDSGLTAAIEATVAEWPGGARLTSTDRLALVKRLYHSFRGLDVLQPLLNDDSVTEIMINGHETIFAERSGKLECLPLSFESRERLEDLIQSIVAAVNRVVNESSPIVDARLPDGSRVHIVLPPIALQGPVLTIRKFPKQPLLMDDLIAAGCLDEEAAAFLAQLVRAGFNLFISGGTGTGKTTFLNALSRFIPPDERLITIEDSAELQLKAPNLVSLETRNANTEGKGEIPMRQLIRASLRMRPDRIIVGEVRGAEALDMLAAMNTGHSGSMGTGHSNSAKDMLSRLETMVLSGAAELPLAAIRQQLASALDIIVHLSRMRDHSRKVQEVVQVTGMKDGDIQLETLFRYEDGAGRGRLRRLPIPLARMDKWVRCGFDPIEAGVSAVEQPPEKN